MSKPVRISDYLLEQVERLADSENRSLANMVHVLLEQALRMEGRDPWVPPVIEVPLDVFEKVVNKAELSDGGRKKGHRSVADHAEPLPPSESFVQREFKPDFKEPAKPKKSRYGK